MSTEREAGRELDAEIAVLMGWTLTAPVDNGCDFATGIHRDGSSAKRNFGRPPGDGGEAFLPLFSTQIAAAFQVVEAMRAKGCEVTVGVSAREKNAFCEIAKASDRGSNVEEAATVPLAICLAALAYLDESTPLRAVSPESGTPK